MYLYACRGNVRMHAFQCYYFELDCEVLSKSKPPFPLSIYFTACDLLQTKWSMLTYSIFPYEKSSSEVSPTLINHFHLSI